MSCSLETKKKQDPACFENSLDSKAMQKSRTKSDEKDKGIGAWPK